MKQARSAHPGWTRLAAVTAMVLIAAHGLAHLMDVALLWELGEPGKAWYADVGPQRAVRLVIWPERSGWWLRRYS